MDGSLHVFELLVGFLHRSRGGGCSGGKNWVEKGLEDTLDSFKAHKKSGYTFRLLYLKYQWCLQSASPVETSSCWWTSGTLWSCCLFPLRFLLLPSWDEYTERKMKSVRKLVLPVKSFDNVIFTWICSISKDTAESFWLALYVFKCFDMLKLLNNFSFIKSNHLRGKGPPVELYLPLTGTLVFSTVQQLVLLHDVYSEFTSQVSFPPRCLVTGIHRNQLKDLLRIYFCFTLFDEKHLSSCFHNAPNIAEVIRITKWNFKSYFSLKLHVKWCGSKHL